ncbi:MAG: hypothetical protein WCI47_01250 [bacterium]
MSKKGNGSRKQIVEITAARHHLGALKRRIEADFLLRGESISVRPGDGWLRVQCQNAQIDAVRAIASEVVNARVKII